MDNFKAYFVLFVSFAVTFHGGETCYSDPDVAHETIKQYYGEELTTSADLKTNACSTSQAPGKSILDAIAKVPGEVRNKFYGCGFPIPLGIEGLNVLDLGSGAGRDCYVVANLVGPRGFVTGIDMTQQQIDVARKHVNDYCKNTLKYPQPNMEYVLGTIEDLRSAGIEDATQDLVISNCVINLSPNKSGVIKGAFNALREGGELYFSDVYSDGLLPEDARNDPILYNECIGGAMLVEEFKKICAAIGFSRPVEVSKSVIVVNDPEMKKLVGDVKFYSITYRVFKVKSVDQNKFVRYLGTISESEDYYVFGGNSFYKNEPVFVDGDTLAILTQSWLRSHFEVVEPKLGDRLSNQAPSRPIDERKQSCYGSSCSPVPSDSKNQCC